MPNLMHPSEKIEGIVRLWQEGDDWYMALQVPGWLKSVLIQLERPILSNPEELKQMQPIFKFAHPNRSLE